MPNAATTQPAALTTTRFECYDDGARWPYAGPATDLEGVAADYAGQTASELGYDAHGPARTVRITVEQIDTDAEGDETVIGRRTVLVSVPEGDED